MLVALVLLIGIVLAIGWWSWEIHRENEKLETSAAQDLGSWLMELFSCKQREEMQKESNDNEVYVAILLVFAFLIGLRLACAGC